MTESVDPSELIRRGQAAARIGARDEARRALRQAVELAPDRPDAWLALAGIEDDHQYKVTCLEKVLALDPGNAEAQLGLDMLRERQAAQVAAVEPADELEAVLTEASRRLEQAAGPLSAAAPAGSAGHPQGASAAARGQASTPAQAGDEALYCTYHPNVETLLRCNRCGKPICTRCAVQTPVGYRCRQCVGQQQSVFYTGGTADYVWGGIIAFLLGGAATFVIALIPVLFFGLILGPAAGIGIAEVVRLAVRRRRSRSMWLVVGAAFLVGALPAVLMALSRMSVWSLASVALFLFLAIGAAAARLR